MTRMPLHFEIWILATLNELATGGLNHKSSKVIKSQNVNCKMYATHQHALVEFVVFGVKLWIAQKLVFDQVHSKYQTCLKSVL